MISDRKRFKVLARCGFQCVYCGKKPPEVVLEVDHLTPRAKGGSDEEWNLAAACYGCNRGKRDDLVPEFMGDRPSERKPWKRIKRTAPRFYTWMKKQLWRDDPVGDLARDITRDKSFPKTQYRYPIRVYLSEKGTYVLHAFYTAWREFCGSKLTAEKMRTLRYELMFDGIRTPYPYQKEGRWMKVDQHRGRVKEFVPYRLNEDGKVVQ